MDKRVILLMCLVSESAAPVVEKQIDYTCEDGPNTLEAPIGAVNPQWDQSWTTGKKPIAYYKNGKGECSFPCKDVFPGKVILSECPDVTLTTGCITKDGVYEETMMYFSVISRQTVSMTTTNTANNPFAHYGLGAFLMLIKSFVL